MQITLREPGSALTHFIAMIMAVGAAVPLLLKAASHGSVCLLAMLVFIISMILLYGASATYHSVIMTSMILLYAASTLYHSVNLTGSKLKLFKKLDHMMIFVLIAGSYTPVCLLVLDPKRGYPLLIAVWSLALIGIGIKFLWITCPKWFSSVIYIAMGWICVFVFSPIVHRLPVAAFGWLLAGGIIYTVGGIIYALKLPLFNARHQYFGSHEIFHLFVMGGSFCHFIFMYQYVIGLS